MRWKAREIEQCDAITSGGGRSNHDIRPNFERSDHGLILSPPIFSFPIAIWALFSSFFNSASFSIRRC
jgi:hypothetical protein